MLKNVYQLIDKLSSKYEEEYPHPGSEGASRARYPNAAAATSSIHPSIANRAQRDAPASDAKARRYMRAARPNTPRTRAPSYSRST